MHLVQRGEPDRVGVGHARPLRLGQRQALLQREGEATADGERAGDPLHQRLLVGKGEHRLEQKHDVERAGRERRDLRDLEAAGKAAGARAGDADRARARVDSDVAAAELPREEPARPGDAAAQVEHGDAGRDARPLRERPDLPRAHEALLLDVLAGVVGRLPGSPQGLGRTDRARPASRPRHKPMHGTHGTSLTDVRARSNAAGGSRPADGAGLPSCCSWPRLRRRSAWDAPAGSSGPRRALILDAALARALWRDPAARLGPAGWVTLTRATLAVGVAALTADSFERDVPVATLVALASARARARLRRRTGRTAHRDGVGAGRAAGRRGRCLPDSRAQRGGRPLGRRLGARDRRGALRVPRGRVGVRLDARAAAAARLAQGRHGRAGNHADGRGGGDPAAAADPRRPRRRARPARRVVRTRRLVAVAAPRVPQRRGPPPIAAAIRGVALTVLALRRRVGRAGGSEPSRGCSRPAHSCRLPLEGIVVVVLAVVLPARARRLLPWVIGPALGLLVLVKLLDIGFFIAFDRPFNPVDDWSYASIGIETVRDTFGRTDRRPGGRRRRAARRRRARPPHAGGAPR